MFRGDLHLLEHHHFRIKYTELNEIYIFQTVRTMALSFVAIFIPIYLINQGFTIKGVLLYNIMFYIFSIPIDIVAAKLIRFIGPKHTIVASIPFILSFIWILETVGKYHWPLWLISLSGALGVALYWQAYHFDFSKAKRKGRATSDVGEQAILINLVSCAAPFIGGFIATEFGEKYLFLFVIGLLSIASIVLFETGDKHQKISKLDFKKLNWKTIRKDMVSYAGYGIETNASMVIWPLFVFLIVKNYAEVGLAHSITLIAAAVVIHWVGKSSDEHAKKKQLYLRGGSIAKALFYFIQTLVSTMNFVYILNVLRAIANSFQNIPWTSEYYLHADEESRSEYLLVMEIGVGLARAIGFIILFIISLYFPLKTVIIFGIIMGGAGSLLAGLMPLSKSEIELKNKEIKIMPRPAKVTN